jgi:hypothetical protein
MDDLTHTHSSIDAGMPGVTPAILPLKSIDERRLLSGSANNSRQGHIPLNYFLAPDHPHDSVVAEDEVLSPEIGNANDYSHLALRRNPVCRQSSPAACSMTGFSKKRRILSAMICVCQALRFHVENEQYFMGQAVGCSSFGGILLSRSKRLRSANDGCRETAVRSLDVPRRKGSGLHDNIVAHHPYQRLYTEQIYYGNRIRPLFVRVWHSSSPLIGGANLQFIQDSATYLPINDS